MRKNVDCIIGLQWGSEGKGKVTAYLADEYNAVVRSGGPQAGHTFYSGKEKYINRQVPCGIFNPDSKLYMTPNSLINIDVLGHEISRYNLYPDRLMIDSHAMVVSQSHIRMEKESSIKARLGSTTEGVGAAQIDKLWRKGKLFGTYAIQDPELYFFCNDTVAAINEQIDKKHSILLEGTQGFGLCLNHGKYPFVTSRDITNSALMSDAGISPNQHNQTIGVMRTYPIRVAGNSGPTYSDRISWKEITRRANSEEPIIEYTSVTKEPRKVFEQSYEILKKAIKVNRPEQIALMFIDYINKEDFKKTDFDKLSKKSKDYIDSLEQRLDIPITLIGTGPGHTDMIDRRISSQIARPSKERWENDFFPENIYNYPWDSGFIERFIDKKMTAPDGSRFKRRIFLNNNKKTNY